MQREVDRALDGYSLDGADRYLRLQIERLDKALRRVDDDIEDGDSTAGGAARRAAPRLEVAAAPLALSRERTPETS